MFYSVLFIVLYFLLFLPGLLILQYCDYCNSIAILTWKTILQSVLQYIFHQVLLLQLQYFLPVLQTTLVFANK